MGFPFSAFNVGLLNLLRPVVFNLSYDQIEDQAEEEKAAQVITSEICNVMPSVM